MGLYSGKVERHRGRRCFGSQRFFLGRGFTVLDLIISKQEGVIR